MQDEPMLRLKLANDGLNEPPLQASLRLLRLGSSLARDLPPDTSTWDLSNLLIDGHAVSRHTVIAWLSIVYMQLEGETFPGADRSPRPNAIELYQLLAFADAVGSIRGVLRACLPMEIPPRFGEQVTFQVDIGSRSCRVDTGAAYEWRTDGRRALVRLCKSCSDGTFIQLPAYDALSAQQVQAFTQQLVGQVEALLYLAYKLQLAPLQDQLHGFIRTNMAPGRLCPPSTVRDVITERVRVPAAGSPQALGAMVEALLDVPRSNGAVAPASPVRAATTQPDDWLKVQFDTWCTWFWHLPDRQRVPLGMAGVVLVYTLFWCLWLIQYELKPLPVHPLVVAGLLVLYACVNPKECGFL